MNKKIKLYTCSLGYDLMKSGSSFWATEDDFSSSSGKKYTIIVSEEFTKYCTRNEDYKIQENSDAMLENDWLHLESLASEEFSAGYNELFDDNTLKITSNYTDGNNKCNWQITKERYKENNNIFPFFIEVSDSISKDEDELGYSCGCDSNYTSLSIEEAEKLVVFLQNKINYIRGE